MQWRRSVHSTVLLPSVHLGDRLPALNPEHIRRYGYSAAHEREDVSPYSTSLTDAEWDLVSHLFERAPIQRGTPMYYSRRQLMNACS